MTDSCYRCGAAREPMKPSRADFTSEPDFLLACLEWLDYAFPQRGGGGQSARIAEWRRLEEAADVERTHARIRELYALDEWTAENEAEVDRLTEAWKRWKREARDIRNYRHNTEEKQS